MDLRAQAAAQPNLKTQELAVFINCCYQLVRPESQAILRNEGLFPQQAKQEI
jgi:hypothetical protein